MQVIQANDLDGTTIKVNTQNKVEAVGIGAAVVATPPRLYVSNTMFAAMPTAWLEITLPDGSVGYVPFFKKDSVAFTDDYTVGYSTTGTVYANQPVTLYPNVNYTPTGGYATGTHYNFSSVNLPSWITLNTANGQVTINLPADTLLNGSHSYDVLVTYDDGSTDIAKVNFTAQADKFADLYNPVIPTYTTIYSSNGGPTIQGIADYNHVSSVSFDNYQLNYYGGGYINVNTYNQDHLVGNATITYIDGSVDVVPYDITIKGSGSKSMLKKKQAEKPDRIVKCKSHYTSNAQPV